MVARLVRDPFDREGWLFELLRGPPHKISSVAFAVMWRWHIRTFYEGTAAAEAT